MRKNRKSLGWKGLLPGSLISLSLLLAACQNGGYDQMAGEDNGIETNLPGDATVERESSDGAEFILLTNDEIYDISALLEAKYTDKSFSYVEQKSAHHYLFQDQDGNGAEVNVIDYDMPDEIHIEEDYLSQLMKESGTCDQMEKMIEASGYPCEYVSAGNYQFWDVDFGDFSDKILREEAALFMERLAEKFTLSMSINQDVAMGKRQWARSYGFTGISYERSYDGHEDYNNTTSTKLGFYELMKYKSMEDYLALFESDSAVEKVMESIGYAIDADMMDRILNGNAEPQGKIQFNISVRTVRDSLTDISESRLLTTQRYEDFASVGDEMAIRCQFEDGMDALIILEPTGLADYNFRRLYSCMTDNQDEIIADYR